ncbi:MAG TPA: oxidoreductase [Acidimicrobiaceae bacterium]|nr:oxidoreductase [Acidimicrobiaceae bacterium]
MPIPSPAPDRTCIVTGASSGIGTEIARVLASRGHGVTLVARRLDRLETLAGQLAERHGIRAEVVVADLTEPAQRRAVVEAVAERGLTPEVLVNNAGFSTVGPVVDIDPGREIQMLRTNVEAVDHLCALVAPGMVERGRGAILNVASTASYQPLPGQAGYAASKAFVRTYTTSLAGELGPHGVTVTALCPGPVRTEFAHASGMDDLADGNPLPEAMWVPVEEVGRIAVDALEDGRMVSIPGPLNRLGAGIANVLPRQVLVPLLARAHPSLR